MEKTEREKLKQELMVEIMIELKSKKEADTFLTRRKSLAKEAFYESLRPYLSRANHGDSDIHKIWSNVQGIANKCYEWGYWRISDGEMDEYAQWYVELVKGIGDAIAENMQKYQHRAKKSRYD
jgi:hypothetical protein